MEKDCLHGLTEESMKEITLTIKSKVQENSFGLMEEDMMENGLTENNMESVFITHLKEKSNKVSGKKVKELDGLQTMNSDCENIEKKYLYSLNLNLLTKILITNKIK